MSQALISLERRQNGGSVMWNSGKIGSWLGLGMVLFGTAPALAQAMPAACPPSPVRIVHSIGAPVEYQGAYPGIPELCFERRADGPGYYYYGVWRDDWPGAGLAFPALRAALAGGNATRVDFVTRSYPGLQWKDSFINEGVEPLEVDGHTYTVLRLAHERQGIEGNTYHSIITSWRDVRTGVTLKTVENQISGQSYGPETTWTATRVEPIR